MLNFLNILYSLSLKRRLVCFVLRCPSGQAHCKAEQPDGNMKCLVFISFLQDSLTLKQFEKQLKRK